MPSHAPYSPQLQSGPHVRARRVQLFSQSVTCTAPGLQASSTTVSQGPGSAAQRPSARHLRAANPQVPPQGSVRSVPAVQEQSVGALQMDQEPSRQVVVPVPQLVLQSSIDPGTTRGSESSQSASTEKPSPSSSSRW